MFDTFNSHLYQCDRPTGRLIPIFGPVSESSGTVAKTPGLHRFPLLGGDLMAAVTLTTIQQFSVSIAPVNAKGKPAKVDGPPVWLTDNTDVLALTPSADGLSCDVVAIGIPGAATIQVSADADLGAGSVLLTGTLEVEVTSAPATNIVLTPGPVTDQ